MDDWKSWLPKGTVDILGIAETHWTEEGKIIQENHTMIYSGGENHRNGVGIVMKNSVAK